MDIKTGGTILNSKVLARIELCAYSKVLCFTITYFSHINRRKSSF